MTKQELKSFNNFDLKFFGFLNILNTIKPNLADSNVDKLSDTERIEFGNKYYNAFDPENLSYDMKRKILSNGKEFGETMQHVISDFRQLYRWIGRNNFIPTYRKFAKNKSSIPSLTSSVCIIMSFLSNCFANKY